MAHANAFENHESSNGEEPVLKTPPPSTPPPPVSGYAVAAGAQQNHVDSAPGSPPPSVVSSRLVNHVSSAVTTMPSSISRTSSLAGNGTDQSMQSNHFSGNYIFVKIRIFFKKKFPRAFNNSLVNLIHGQNLILQKKMK